MGNNYSLLISKINEFTRKFYLNKLLRGSMYAAALILSLYLCLFVWIFYAYPSISTKTLLFFSFIIISLTAIAFWIVKPALSYFKLRKTLTLEQAANLIGNHFFNVKDRLLNTLQLKELADSSPQNSALILAGIDQKINELKPIPFSNAVKLGDNKKHIKYIALPLSIILLIGIIAPAILREGTSSFIRYNQEVLPQAPFQFIIENKSLNITQGDDLTLKVKLTGDEFPQDIYLEDGVNSYKLQKQDISHFSYTFKNIQKDKNIRFSGGGFSSASHTISVKPRPSLLNLSATLVYPAYLERKNENVPNVGDLLIPEGTKVNWKLKTENSDEINFILAQKTHQILVTENAASFSAVIRKNGLYQIVPKNKFVSLKDSLSHQLTVIADQYPVISVTETPDSLSSKALYFTGIVNDDYGFSSLKFRYQIKEKNKVVGQGAKAIAIKNKQIENSFFHLWNLNDINTKPGQTIEYFFEVADNDGVNGPKIVRSEIKTFKAPTQQEIAEKLAEGSKSLKDKMEQTIKLANTIEKESKKLSENLLDKKQINFEDKKQIEQLLDKQKQLEDAVKDIKAQNEKNNLDKQESGQQDTLNEELKEKQKKINELFNDVLDEKTKELLKKLQQLMDQNNKDQTRNELSKMQMDNKSVKNELDRILELYKQLEFEQDLQNKIDRLNEMAKLQKDLSEQSKSVEKSNKNQNSSPQDLKDKQNQLNKDFKDLKKGLQDLDKKNQNLERPNEYKNPEKETSEIEKSQQESKDQLNQNNHQLAAEKQQQAGEQMQKLAEQMQEKQQAGAEEENKVNAQELRKLLENLLSTSFEQEKVMLSLRKMGASDPAYVSQAQKQNMIRDNMKTITDSLFSLSKRVPQIESTVNTEVEKINFNIGRAIDFLGDRRTGEANRSQQFAMTSLNNLALMLNEALEQLQNTMKNAKGGKGKQKQGMEQLQKMQEQLNKNMQQAKDKMQKEGNNGTVPKGQMSQEFAKMAQEQQMIREALEKINKEDNKDGKGSLGNLNQAVQEMKQSELDLVNKRITQETLNRQKNLMVKLLDAEKAQREQEQDSKRESKSAQQFPPSYKQMLEKFNKSMQNESELIQKLPPNLNYYYKNKVAEYFKLLNK